MSVDRFIEFFNEDFESEITESISVSEDEFRTLDIFGVLETSPMEILKDDPSAYRSAKLKWISEFFEEAKSYVDSIKDIWQNDNRFKDIIAEIKSGNLSPFVGSGMSANSGFKTWVNFLKSIQNYSDLSNEEFADLVQKKKYDQLATRICECMDPTLNAEIFRSTFHIREQEMKSRLGGSVRLLPILFRNLVVTTNYDNVIEAVYGNFNVHFKELLGLRIEDYQPNSMGGARILLKLHGDSLNLKSRVLTESEYDIAYASGSDYVKTLEDIYSANQFLFIGCSLDGDRTLDTFRSVFQLGRIYRKHYAFLPIGKHLKSPLEKEDFIRSRDEFLRNMGIYAIWYTGDHDDALLNLLVALIAEVGVEV